MKPTKPKGLAVATSIQLSLLRDSRFIFQSRKTFDTWHRFLQNAEFPTLYKCWKSLNAFLVSGDPARLPSELVFAGLDLSSPETIRRLRQILGFPTRLEDSSLDATPFISEWSGRVSSVRGRIPARLRSVARSFCAELLGPCPGSLLEVTPRHGPGAVAEGYCDLQKTDFRSMFRDLVPLKGYEALHLNERHLKLEPHQPAYYNHGITRVIAVPKDRMKPRIISAEPHTLMFFQQGVARYLMPRFEWVSRFRLNFSDQEHNRKEAAKLSNATLDLSNASDLVSLRHVRDLVPDDWWTFLSACRSHFAQLPCGTRVPLRCFAPMGSALCFPIEAMIFYCLIGAHFAVDRKEFWRAHVSVYGDDIIVPVTAAASVLQVLREAGFVPNEEKCCYRTPFRESCGAEYFSGIDISVRRPRTLFSSGNTPGQLPMVELANWMYDNGYPCTASYIASVCPFTVALGNGNPYAHFDLPWKHVGRVRWNRDIQEQEAEADMAVQVMRPRAVSPSFASLSRGLMNGWASEQVPTPYCKVKRRWVVLRPLGG